MKAATNHNHTRAGDHLRKLVRFGSFGGLLFSLIGTGLVWAGTDSFNCSATVWKLSLAINLADFFLTWAAYMAFRNTDLLIGNGILMILVLFNMFWTFGFGGFYFYFLFAPINFLSRAAAILILTTMLFYRAYKICCDITEVIRKNKRLFNCMYCDEGDLITFKRDAIGLLENARRDRKSFSPIHAYAAMLVTPFVFALNKLSTPVLGEGHGVFLVLAFFAAPMLLWGIEIFVQTIATMIYYPIKLHQETGRQVLLKDW